MKNSTSEKLLNNRMGYLQFFGKFQETPDERFLADKLAKAEKMGGDIAKIALMSKDYNDILSLL